MTIDPYDEQERQLRRENAEGADALAAEYAELLRAIAAKTQAELEAAIARVKREAVES